MINKLKIYLSYILLSAFFISNGQEGHYWSENFGNKSTLLSGTVNANVSDLGAVFYNPGRLSLIKTPAFAINAEVYELNIINIEDGVNKGTDLKERKFGGAPSLAAGSFRIPFLKGHMFAYSFLTRLKFDADFLVRVEEQLDDSNTSTNETLYNGRINYDTRAQDEWLGLSWSPPISDKFGIGLSNFVSILNKTSLIGVDVHVLDELNNVSALVVNHKYNYKSYGMLWKLGMAWKLSRINLGLTVTTPRLNIVNDGSFLYEEYLVNANNSENGELEDIYIFNVQNDLPVNYHTPWAIGFGTGIHFNKMILHVSAEWYNKVSRYTILQPESFIGQSTGESVDFKLVDELNPVFNYGLGMEITLNNNLTAFASVASDYSAAKSELSENTQLDSKAVNTTLVIDFFQFGGGISIEKKNIEITIGVTYRGSSQQVDRPVNFPNGDDTSPIDSDNTTMMKIQQWSFILGFTFPYANRTISNKGIY